MGVDPSDWGSLLACKNLPTSSISSELPLRSEDSFTTPSRSDVVTGLTEKELEREREGEKGTRGKVEYGKMEGGRKMGGNIQQQKLPKTLVSSLLAYWHNRR